MFKKVSFKSLRQDLRKIAVAFIIGGLTGLYLHPDMKWISFAALTVTGMILWYFGLCDGGN
ncbi:MAG: hypothetical protein PVG30_00175 [Gammaproteobacteria bacterium]|jgi:hypothetical protein